MIELLQILFFSFVFTTFFFLPYYRVVTFKNKINIPSLIDKNILNILLVGNSFLILSFFNISLSSIIKIFYLLTFVSLFIFFRDFKNLSKIFYYYLFFFVLIIFFLSVDLAYNLTLYWDAQKFWFLKTIHFFNNESLYELKNVSKPEYPYFGSLAWAFFWKLSNLDYEYFGRIFFNIVLCFSIYSIVDLLKISNLKKLILFLIFLFVIYDYWHLRGSQEILVFSFLLICSKYLYLFVNEKKIDYGQLIIFFLSLNLLIWTKNEGIFFGLFVVITFLFYSKINLKFKIIIFTIFLLLAINRFTIFDIYGLSTNIADKDDFNLLNLFSSLINNLSLYNLYFITKNVLFSVVKFPFIIISLFFMFILFNKITIKEKNFFIFFYFILNIFFIYFIYFSATPHLELMVLTSLNRILFESSAPFLLFPVIYMKKIFKI